jgi:IS30 family transposase
MGKKYSHLNHSERTLIFWWKKDKLSAREIARRMKRSHTTISRELRRNYWLPNDGYSARSAQECYEYRLKHRARRFRLKSEIIRKYVTKKLKIGWTPELISGRLKREDPENYICHESIYQYIYLEASELIEYLPRKHVKRRIKHPYRSKPQRIKGRVSLTERPTEADERTQCGHWEADTIVSVDRKCGLNVLIDRKLRLAHISFIKDKTAMLTHKAIVKRLKNQPKELLRTITYDNGTENTQHLKTNNKLEITSYFCEPYHSWEKGSVEQVNGLIRRFFPKGTFFESLTYGEIIRVEK